MDKVNLQISWGSLWKVVAMVLLLSVAYISRDVLLAVVLAFVIAASVDPFVTWLERRRIPRLIGTLTVYLISLFGVALFLYIVVPVMLTEVSSILESSQDVFGNLVESLGIESTALQTIAAALNEFTNGLLGGQTNLVGFLSQIFGGLLLAVIVSVISFYLTIGRDGVERFLRAVVPVTSQSMVIMVYERIRVKISHWFAGQLFLSLLMTIVTYAGLAILGVKYAFVLAITAGLFELVPYVGPIFAGALTVLVAFTQSTTLGLYSLGLFVILQQLESHVFVPMVNRYTLNLNPVVVIVALLIGGTVLGIVGAIIAIPVAVFFQEIIKHLGHQKEQGTGGELLS
jgi:predicted PurR-regulated permease PerM